MELTPFSTKEEFTEFDKRLGKDKEFYQNVVGYSIPTYIEDLGAIHG